MTEATQESWEQYLDEKRKDLKIEQSSIISLILNEMSNFYDHDKKYLVHCSYECMRAIVSDPRAVFIGQLRDSKITTYYVLPNIGKIDFLQDIEQGYKIEEI